MLAAALLPVLERHLERDLDRGRAGVRVEDPVQPRRGDLDQARAPARRRRGWERPSIVEWATRSSCSRTRRVDRRVAVAVDVAPERGDAVEVAAPLGVDQLGALGALDHQRLLRHPVALLRERVPEVIVIELGSFLHSPLANIRSTPDGLRLRIGIGITIRRAVPV